MAGGSVRDRTAVRVERHVSRPVETAGTQDAAEDEAVPPVGAAAQVGIGQDSLPCVDEAVVRVLLVDDDARRRRRTRRQAVITDDHLI